MNNLIKGLVSGKQFVIVKFEIPTHNNEALVFLVDDTEKPQVPGFPARACEYYRTVEEARKVILEFYNTFGFPKNKGYLTIYV